ncbi:peptide chain release factor N(5)-glutamine methyltransferase [Acidisoma sp. 7E03]
MTVDLDATLRDATARLGAAGIEEPYREARILLAAAIGADLAGLLRRRGGTLTAAEAESYVAMVAKRAMRISAAHVLGHREFWSLDFLVTEDTLAPRPDSEVMIETALALRRDRAAVRRILDLGTGTGCLLLAALSEYPEAWGLGVDLSPRTAAVAAENARRLGMAPRCAIAVGRWWQPVSARFDLILCNPPYIPAADIAGLMPEVRDHEPRLALDGGMDGLDPYRLLFADLPNHLNPGGLALFEFGIGQAEALERLAVAAGLGVRALRADLGGQPRVLAVSHR